MLEDILRIPELMCSGYFLTNVLPFWVGTLVAFAAVGRWLRW